ncbi:MAG: UDP-N-acetylmuramate dehydrogenase [Lachnospiraceae bacterium]|nr:UDP-N-acetylmuramate dehydrogenase [Lachnospiraceae bacterium]
MRGEIIKEIEQILPAGQILRREPMSRHTTFRVGGPAELFLEIRTASEIQKLLTFFQESGTKYFIVGNGSNLLVSDGGYDGAILHIGEGFDKIGVVGEKVRAQAGALLGRAALTAQQNSLTGLEFAFGIPGSVGGAAVMNAGAYGGEMSQVVSMVTGFTSDGDEVKLSNKELDFGYRKSILKQEKIVVAEVEFCLSDGSPEEISMKMNDLTGRRRAKQPLEYPSAGSTFKRPEGHFAGKLIMDAGLKGLCVGGAQVSEKHCGFIINKGGATAADVRQLMKKVQDRVKEQSGVELEPEIICLE